MKCAVCGKEFGNGSNCKNCGTDRVTGLANYSGYDGHTGNVYHRSTDNMEYVSNKTTACYACGEIIPADAEYCPYCRKKLYEDCPKCGKTYSSQYDNCPKCGTNLKQYLKEEREREFKRTEEAIKFQLAEQYKREAQYLRDNLPPNIAGVSTALISAWIVFCLTPFCPVTGHGDISLFLVIGISVLIWIITAMICLSIRDKNIRNWKEEHPNDPRSKYL